MMGAAQYLLSAFPKSGSYLKVQPGYRLLPYVSLTAISSGFDVVVP